jgi:hypothetical protein
MWCILIFVKAKQYIVDQALRNYSRLRFFWQGDSEKKNIDWLNGV